MTTELGARVTALRESAKLSINELAKLAGMGHSHLGKVESGERARPSGETLRRIAEALRERMAERGDPTASQVSVDYLLTGK